MRILLRFFTRRFLFFLIASMLFIFTCVNFLTKSTLKAQSFSTSLTALDESPLNNRIPLVLIHGLFGEEYPADWLDFIDYFNSDHLLTRKYKLYEFRYVSNVVDVCMIASAFKNDVENMSELEDKKIVILAHSLGDLLRGPIFRSRVEVAASKSS